MENSARITLSNTTAIQSEKEIYFNNLNIFLKLVDMEDKNTGIQFLYHFRMFQTRVLGEYISFLSSHFNLGPLVSYFKRGKERWKLSEHGSSLRFLQQGGKNCCVEKPVFLL